MRPESVHSVALERNSLKGVMAEDQIPGGAGPALAAHSKDGSAHRPTPMSSATGTQDGRADPVPKTASRLSEQAREAAGRITSSVYDGAGAAHQSLSGQGGRAVDQAAEFVREQPVVALAVTGAICLVLGLLLGRR
jgi:ElaB/YqjD/DUF883 family membrane-anchored ribosome-binding protein